MRHHVNLTYMFGTNGVVSFLLGVHQTNTNLVEVMDVPGSSVLDSFYLHDTFKKFLLIQLKATK